MALATAPRRIGVYGGAFDPPHAAHLAVARAAIEQLALDVLHVIPTGDAWHKSRPLSPARDRLVLCRLAFAGWPKLRVDDRELRRVGPTYTIDTLGELRAQYPRAELFLVIGSDQAEAFARWRRASDIVRLATVAIAARADATVASAPFDQKMRCLACNSLVRMACGSCDCPRCRTAPPTSAPAWPPGAALPVWCPPRWRGILPTIIST
ncbi:nicotinate (nicotinamide) nucleotide adenylyltransferase [Ottowia pentelensis]|uniref:nicotinate (nicotinamide) nucleotide adenylyltransferase n=1 Tax=Ottowia pentelensis TaxID=511108 RepID=UPI0036252142